MESLVASIEAQLAIVIGLVNSGQSARAMQQCVSLAISHPPHPGVLQLLTVLELQAGAIADAKQKISLGRGLVREDVRAVLFDEPLTVIDPHLKWQLRRKLKQIHSELKLTFVYVTHDQVEALTFADQVVVMTRGRAVQIGSATDLFERPQHTFVGHFIGSPGMNFLPITKTLTTLEIAGQRVESNLTTPVLDQFKVGIRPEYVTLTDANDAGAVRATVTQTQDVGTYWLITATVSGHTVRARVGTNQPIPKSGETIHIRVLNAHSCFYNNEVLIA